MLRCFRRNRRGQFSILAAMFVAIILISSVMLTYQSVRYSSNMEEPHILSAIDETNLALKQVLGFTVGYYGSVLQVTGNSTYARTLADRYLMSGLENVADIRPEWGSSFDVTGLELTNNWFMNESYSKGTLNVTYSLTGLEISGIAYSASLGLNVTIFPSDSPNRVCLNVTRDEGEPINDLGKQNFEFYRYRYGNLTWEMAHPTTEPVAFSNGTYLIDIPQDMPEINPYAYIMQVKDTRGITVAASSYSHYTSTLTFNSTYADDVDYVDNSNSDVDSASDEGSQNSFPAQQTSPDSNYDNMLEGNVGTVPNQFYPDSYNPIGSTLVGGGPGNLAADDNSNMTFMSSNPPQTLYSHQETTLIAGQSYYRLVYGGADASGTTLSQPMSSSRVLLGKSVFSLQGISSIPASAWTMNYRAWQEPSIVAFDSASSVDTATTASSVSWSHTTGAANNRLLVVAISVHVATGSPTTVTSVTYNGVALTQVTTALYSAATPQVRTYIYRLVNPASGTKTVTVNFAESTLYVCGATTYANVDPGTPIQTSQTATGSSTSPSVQVSVTGTGRTVFGHLAGHRTSSQVTYQSAGAGSGTTGNPTPAYPSGLQAGDLILLQVTVRANTNAPATPTGFTLLYGPDPTGTTGRQWIYYKFAVGTESGSITVSIGGSSCKVARMYSFRNVDPTSINEGGGFGSGSSSTINAQSVTTTGINRLAVSFVFVCDDNGLDSFTGESGGNWAEAVSEFTTSQGSDGAVGLQTATMTAAGTISGGSDSMSNSDPWGVRAFALKPKTTLAITEGGGQNNRWAEETNLYKGRGSDRLNVAAGSVTMSWSTDAAPNWVCSAVVINPVSGGYCNIDVLIRKSDGTIRNGVAIATNVANSSVLTSTPTTLSGTYSWGTYAIVDQTDYLEIDYYACVTTTSSLNAYLRIDDASLANSSQTRLANILLSSEQTCSFELYGPSSSTTTWNNLIWNITSAASLNGVGVTYQLYNYRLGVYPISGDGFMTATLGIIKVKNQSLPITVNASDFRDSNGRWSLKVTAVKETSSAFNVSVDFVKFEPGFAVYRLDLEEQWSGLNSVMFQPTLCIKTGNLTAGENFAVDFWNSSLSQWENIFYSLIENSWNNKTIDINPPLLTIRFRSSDSNDYSPSAWQLDAVLFRSSSHQEMWQSMQNPEAVMAVEVLQNGTMRWLGQELRLMNSGGEYIQGIPIPPVPVKAIHVNQTTIWGESTEVPFQIEDWGSNYNVPLGLTNNETVFGNRQMIVSLINTTISEFTIWWNGSDSAIQTPKAYSNLYFTGDNPDDNVLTNGVQTLSIVRSSFTVTSTVNGASTTTNFMRVNNESSVYGAGSAYVIHHGVVRDVVQQEAEWNGGADGCPNLYANIVLTLPAHATYFTYQLRFMFMTSEQPRNIDDLCTVEAVSSVSNVQPETEDGVYLSNPLVSNRSGTFTNTDAPWTSHHWSQFIDGDKGSGIMFTDANNQMLYYFDSFAGFGTGALKVSNTTRTVEVLPVSSGTVSFQTPLDVTWYGAVVTFHNTYPIYMEADGGMNTGLWIFADLPPTITVTTDN